MKINDIKINGFGKVKDKQIKLSDGINIIYGENEKGKSTILKFIISMLYGINKNKNGGTIPEIEKYEPWDNEEFSGKISYKLDNEDSYEVYRDFKKKNPKIFNQNLEDISKEFNIDKTKGNQFFYDQVGLEEDIFTSSVITKQAEVKLDTKNQNTIIQKISNILNTGEDTTSYTSIVNKLKKKINEDIGTSNTRQRPINIIENKINILENEKKELENYQSYKFDINEKIEQEKEQIEKEEKELIKLREANIKVEKLKEDENRIKIKKEVIDKLSEDIEKVDLQKNNYKINKKTKLSKINIAILIIILALTVAAMLLINNIIAKISMVILLIAYSTYLFFNISKQKNENKKIKSKKKELEETIKILEQNKEKQYEEFKQMEKEYDEKMLKIKEENNIINVPNILEMIDEKQRKINQISINLHTLKIDNNNVMPKLEKLVNVEEELESLKEEKKELEAKREIIKKTLEYLEIAYNKMKEQITPKFTEELSKTMINISDGKYQNVRINTNGDIVVETTSGNYINAENLSIGTIDQLYLSLRIAATKEITKENMPIILDEAFAYYDENRLENILRYLSEEYSNKQIIIFTCTKREKDVMNKLNAKYNLVEL